MRDFDAFCKKQPSHQNAVDIFRSSWKAAFPSKLEIEAGTKNVFENHIVERVDAALSTGVRGSRVLEIGPYEGHYTYQLEQLEVESITAVEVNVKNYLKCLIVKEVCGLRASFLLGDFMQMEPRQLKGYDLCFAAGVLYHQTDPLEMLKKMSDVADRLYVWTHVYGDVIDRDMQAYPNFAGGIVVEKELMGYSCLHYCRSYLWKNDDQPPKEFSGGPQSFAYWLRKSDLLAFLDLLGYKRISILIDSETHAAGPVLALTAERS
ncbi:MAG: class I SAM-dependent methyltransferase [Acidimicrobiia bacterium]